MVKFTFLEIHLDNADIDGTAQATADAVTALPFSNETTGEPDEADDESDVAEIEIDDEDEETTISLAPLFLILGLVVLAIVLKKRLRSAGDE